MDFNCLDKESEDLLGNLLKKSNILNDNIGGTAIQHLIRNGYISGISSTTQSDTEPQYVLTGITQKGKSYFELKEIYGKRAKASVWKRMGNCNYQCDYRCCDRLDSNSFICVRGAVKCRILM